MSFFLASRFVFVLVLGEGSGGREGARMGLLVGFPVPSHFSSGLCDRDSLTGISFRLVAFSTRC